MASVPSTSPLSPPTLGESGSDASNVLRHDTRARFWLALVVIIQFVMLVAYVSYRGTQLADSQLILGAEISFVTIVLNYFFGSSAGSVTKSASSMDASHHG